MRGRRGGAGGGHACARDLLRCYPTSSDPARGVVPFAKPPPESAHSTRLSHVAGSGPIERAPGPVACLFGPVSAMHRCRVVGSAIRHRPASGEGLDRDRRPFTPGTFSIALPADRERATAPSSAAPRERQAPAHPLIVREARAGGRPGRWNLQGCFDSQTAPAAQARHPPAGNPAGG